MIRATPEMLIRRAGELGVSLDISDDHDEAADTRALGCRDKLTTRRPATRTAEAGTQRAEAITASRNNKVTIPCRNGGPDLRGRRGRGESRGRAPMGVAAPIL